MKRILSFVLVAAMLVGVMFIVPSAQAATLDRYNVAAEAYYYGGSVSWAETYDSNGETMWTDAEVVKEGDFGNLLLDGIINPGEWGDPVVHVDSSYAANNGGRTYGKNNAFEAPSAENTYYYYTLNDKKNSNTPKGLNYDLYLMWDEDYLYVAAHVIDMDGHFSDNKGGADGWDGDAFQFRVDPYGPNSVTGGTGYDAIGGDSTYQYPWTGMEFNDKHGVLKEELSNIIVSSHNGYTEIFDAAFRYDPEEKEYTFNDQTVGTVTQYKGGWATYWDYVGPASSGAYGSASTRNIGSAVLPKNSTDYEVAIPWDLIQLDYAAVAGNELGIATALLNSKGGGYNAWLGWGTGVCGYQMVHDPQTCGGSNSLTLSATPYNTARCAHTTFNPATCLEPETCAECGYQRGYKSGHHYDFSDVKFPSANKPGSIKATCTVCNDVDVREIATAYPDVKTSFKTTDSTILNKGFNSGFGAQWRASDEKDEKGNWIGALVYNPDDTAKNTYDNTTFPEVGAVLDLYGNGSNVTTITGDVDNQDQAGTYFDIDSWQAKYCYKMDVYFPDLTTNFDADVSTPYNMGIRNWFGKDTNYGFYSAGLFKIEDEYYFAVIDAGTGDSHKTTKEVFEAKALSFTKATAEDMSTQTWHTYAFMYDEDSATAIFAWDGRIVAAASDYHMAYQYNEGTCMFRRFGMGLYVKDIVFGASSLISDYAAPSSGAAEKYTVTVDGVATEYEVGETVTLEKGFYYDGSKGHRFSSWTGDVDVLADATQGVTSFEMPARDITLTSNYIIVGDANGDGNINGVDANYMQRIITGAADPIAAMDINADGGWNGADANLLKRIITGSYTPIK